MNIKELEQKIIEERDIIKKINGELSPTIIDLKSICCILYKELVIKKVEERIKSNPEITKSLGIEKLRALKGDMNELLELSTSIISNAVDSILCHETYIVNKNDFEGSHYSLKKDLDDKLHNVLQKSTIEISKLLKKYGYIKEFTYTNNDYDEWSVNYNHGKGATIYVQFNEDIELIYEKYKNEIVKIHDSLCRIRKWSEEKEKQEAEDLWNLV